VAERHRFWVATSGLAVLGLLGATMLGGLVGCAQNDASSGPQPAITSAAGGPPVVQGERSLAFFDADVFDLNFADELKRGTDRIHVEFVGSISLNACPARMNVWLAEVKKSDGTISLVDPDQKTPSRGLFGIGIIFDLIDSVNTMRERRAAADRLALARIYNGEIRYDSTNGMAHEVLFTRRSPPAPATGPAPTTGPTPATAPAPAN
jgi:hypothetical protein